MTCSGKQLYIPYNRSGGIGFFDCFNFFFDKANIQDAQDSRKLNDLLSIGTRHCSVCWAKWIETVERRMEANIFLGSQIQIQTWFLKDDANRLTYRFALFRDIIARTSRSKNPFSQR